MAKTKVLITVTTYPLPSDKYQELVCTAGLLENGEWIRIYPIPLSNLVQNRFRKYDWITLDLEPRDPKKDFRPGTYQPVNPNLSDLKVIGKIDTKYDWEERKKYCCKKVYTNVNNLIADAYNPKLKTSLATYKPKRIIDLNIYEDEKDWKPQWKAQIEQLCIFTGDDFKKLNIQKIPYKFKYRFVDGDNKTREIMIEDWEIGALYWKCLKAANQDKKLALEKLKLKYMDDLAKTKDLHFFMGSTLQWHKRKGTNPFVIVGLFYPPIVKQTRLDL